MEKLLGILGLIAILGLVAWFLTTLPMPPIFRNLIILVISIAVIIILLQFFGVNIGIPRLK